MADTRCPDCRGTGVDSSKTTAARKADRLSRGEYIQCWACNGNGLDPATFFNWGTKKEAANG